MLQLTLFARFIDEILKFFERELYLPKPLELRPKKE